MFTLLVELLFGETPIATAFTTLLPAFASFTVYVSVQFFIESDL